MMTLPPSTHPWESRIERRHKPRQARGRRGYVTYRQCLRWEFGFTCSFCLIHEADLVLHGAEGTGTFQVEHFLPVSQDPAGTNVYENCFLSCRFCNGSRGAQLNVDPQVGSSLINPCTHTWKDHFRLERDELLPADGDGDASYTHDTYDINEPRRIKMRQRRRETISEALRMIDKGREIHDLLIEKAEADSDPDLVRCALSIGEAIKNAWRNLSFYKLIPTDAEDCCRCRDKSRCRIPTVIKKSGKKS